MSELSTISRHAITVLAGQLAVMAFGVTDTIVAGRHGEASLAALSVGSAIFISVYVALIGVLQALLPVWAELRGARQTDSLGRSLRQSLYLCGAASLVGMAILLSPAPLLRWTEVPQELQSLVKSYLRGRQVLSRTLMLVDSRHGLKEVDREMMKTLERERDLKRSGQVTASSDPNVVEFRGADYFLTGKLQGLTTKSSQGTSDYILYSFRLTDARTSEIVWESSSEIKKQGLEDAAYR